jgi:NAD(P)-dependent dehydrogenase (short-subunit alcohol dehydrogenase family)
MSSSKRFVIITGGNKGIGEALGKRLLALSREDLHLIIAARSDASEAFHALAKERKAVVTFVKMDLLQHEDLGKRFTNDVLQKITQAEAKSIWFFQVRISCFVYHPSTLQHAECGFAGDQASWRAKFR